MRLYQPIPSLEGDEEEVKEEKWTKILTPSKLLIRLPILLAKIKGGNISYKLKNKIRQIKLPRSLFVIRVPKSFYFNFDLPKDVEKNLKHETQLILKLNESLAEHKIKNNIRHLSLK